MRSTGSGRDGKAKRRQTMRKLFLLCSCILALALAGCATPYQPAGFGGGYRESETAPGTWRVVFSGSGATSRETLRTYWLYRCVTLTREKGYDAFEILSRLELQKESGSELAAQGAIRLSRAGGAGGGAGHGGGGRGEPAPSATRPRSRA
jgi:hypothetical protein